MKRILIILVALALVLSIGAAGVYALEAGRRGNYVDGNNDAICDNRGSCYKDADGDGSCDNRDQCYTDADGDRVCDNRSEKDCGRQHGHGSCRNGK